MDCTLPPVRVLIAPDKFKGTLTAVQAAEAIAAGWRRADSDAELDLAPMADGGDGTLDTLSEAMGGRRVRQRVAGPLGDPVDAEFALIQRPGDLMAVVEMARASGLSLVTERRLDPMRATSRGTGELILAAAREGAETILVGIGGSATIDGGAGMAQAVGIRLLDEQGRDLPPGGGALVRLARIDMSGLDPVVASRRVVAATDVDNPLTGPKGAATVYGPQKGAGPEDVAVLDRALAHLAVVILRDLGIDVRTIPGAGAAGGLGAGLVAFLGAHLRPGVDVVMDAVGLEERIRRSDLAITGEGRFDQQSLRGKVPAGVLRLASENHVRAVVICGQRHTDVEVEDVPVFSLTERFGFDQSMTDPGRLLRDLVADIAPSLELG